MFSVAIDGPAGAGKSTIARTAAAEFGFIYVDTGALYRTIALACIECGADVQDADAVTALLPQLQIRLVYQDAVQRVLLNDRDVSDMIRTEQVSMSASLVSRIPGVRAFLLHLQRQLAQEQSVIMDGRDIGTVVLPEANVKIFLTASPESRADRRLLQLQQQGEKADYEAIYRDIVQRDEQDMHRVVAPLTQAEDAVVLDTTEMTLEQSIRAVCGIIRKGMDEK